MNYLRYVPIVCIIGAIVGFISVTQLWVHSVAEYPWLSDMTGLDLMNCDWGGFQAYVPMIVVLLSALTVIISVMTMTVRGFWFGTFICLIFGMGTMIVTSLFSMWVVEGEKMVHFVDIGFWLSYVAGAITLLGVALQYSMMFRKPVKAK